MADHLGEYEPCRARLGMIHIRRTNGAWRATQQKNIYAPIGREYAIMDVYMNARTDMLLKALALIASGLMFYQKIASGTIAFYINKRFEWLIFAGVLIYLALGLTLLYRVLVPAAQKSAIPESVTSRAPSLSWMAIGLLAIPALLGFLIPARPLGASAIASRGIGLQSAPAANTTTLRKAQIGPRNILDWLREISSVGDPAELAGEQVDVIGFVYRDDPRFEKNQFMVSRFSISCCVADSAALGLMVEIAPDKLAAFKQDDWVRVTGRFKTSTFAGDTMPIVVADSIEATDAPAQPYLYP
jgi:putative membrane protein